MLDEESPQTMPSQNAEELRANIEKVTDIIVHFSKTQKQMEKTETGIRRDSRGCREDKD
jgi:hypothetical protein